MKMDICVKKVKAKKFIIVKYFDGFPKETDLKLVEEELPPIKDGEFLAKAIFISVDPYVRPYSSRLPLASTLLGYQVAKVIESKNPKYPVGTYLVAHFGWRTHTISDGTRKDDFLPPWIIPDLEGLPLSLHLGILGMPGMTAYFGFLEICKPKPGETVVVSGAAGAVGSIVGQIAKIKGCTVIGIAGSEQKGKWLVNELGFDGFINYKDKDFEKKLEAATPNGIDCYFDNIGGEISATITKKMNHFGRISVCGAISGYNDQKPEKVSQIYFSMISKELKMEGFIVRRWFDRWLEGINQHKQWIKEGKLKYRETITEGFDNMSRAFVDMLKGGNFGKAVVKV